MKRKSISYAKWGYIFLIPFFVVYIIFSLYPLFQTFYYSFTDYVKDQGSIGGGWTRQAVEVTPTFCGFDNYSTIFTSGSDLLQSFWNTIIMWIVGFIPQIVISLILAVWFTDLRLKIKAQGFFKAVIYLPNVIMASAFAMLFFTLFADGGPINAMLIQAGILKQAYSFFSHAWSARTLVAVLNFLMWFGNTTIMLMAAVMGISMDIFEASELDGCNSIKRFFYITLPLIRPILAYTLITSIIGGLQMFDVPQILTNGQGNPDRTSMTLIMFLNSHLKSKNYGMAGALSVYLFIVSGILCMIVYKMTNDTDPDGSKKAAKKKAKEERRRR